MCTPTIGAEELVENLENTMYQFDLDEQGVELVDETIKFLKKPVKAMKSPEEIAENLHEELNLTCPANRKIFHSIFVDRIAQIIKDERSCTQ